MSWQVFADYFRKFNSKMAAEARRVLVIMDNALCHKVAGAREERWNGFKLLHLSNTTLCFLPPNVTSIVQPLDQGAWSCVHLAVNTLACNKVVLRLHGDASLCKVGHPVCQNAGIIAAFKAHYRQELLRWKVSEMDKQLAASDDPDTVMANKV
jgi:DDE superfamily endonuclease